MLYKDVKLEKRSDNEPKFDPKNKTDRKIMLTVIILTSVLLLLIGVFIALYFIFFFNK